MKVNSFCKALAVFTAFILICIFILWRGSANAERETQDALRKSAFEANQQLPAMISAETRADPIEVGPGTMITYNYCLVSKNKSEVSASAINAMLRLQIYQMCHDIRGQLMTTYRKQGVELHFKYTDRHGELITEMILTPRDY